MDDRAENADEFIGFCEERIEPSIKEFTSATYAQAKARLFGFLEGDSRLRDEVGTTGSAIRLLDVGTYRRPCGEDLIGKCTADWATGVKKLRCADDLAAEVQESFPNVEWLVAHHRSCSKPQAAFQLRTGFVNCDF